MDPAAVVTADISPAAPVRAVSTPWSGDTGWQILRWTVVALAVLSRLWWLDGRPPHFDEGVNGWFTDQMRHQGGYVYDSGNYHGPLHFYALFLFKCLFGRNMWALRLPTALIGVLTVEWCFRFERFFGRRTSAWAAVAMLVSPATVYFQRDAIHEAWLLYFLVLGLWGVCGLWQAGARRHLWAVGMAAAGMVLTKETYVLHFGCLFVAVGCLLFAEWLRPSRRSLLLPEALPPPTGPEAGTPRAWVTLPEPALLPARLSGTFAPQRWNSDDLFAVVCVALGLILFFYSGSGYYPWGDQSFRESIDPHGTNTHNGLLGLYKTFSHWSNKGEEGEGHQKPFFYWCRLIVRNEPWVVLGLLASLRYAVPALPRGAGRLGNAGLAVAVVCVASIAAFHAWAGVPWPFPGFRPPAFAAGVFWWVVAAVALAVAGACMLIPPPAERWRRLGGLAALAVCLAAFALPAVQARTPLLAVAFGGAALATACLSLPAPGDWRMRLLAIYGIGTLMAYSIIRYKTPWCIISILWPFFFTGGAALAELATVGLAAGRGVGKLLGTAAGVLSAVFAVDLNFRRPTDENFHQPAGENLSYVYVQSFNDVWTVTNFLLAEARADPTFLRQDGVILCESTYPLPWLLGDFKNIGYYTDEKQPAQPDGYHVDFLLVTDHRVEEVEAKLDADYYKQPIRLRPALDGLQLYLRASRFAHLMPAGREPEFHFVPEAPAVPGSGPGAPPMPEGGVSPPPPATVEDGNDE